MRHFQTFSNRFRLFWNGVWAPMKQNYLTPENKEGCGFYFNYYLTCDNKFNRENLLQLFPSEKQRLNVTKKFNMSYRGCWLCPRFSFNKRKKTLDWRDNVYTAYYQNSMDLTRQWIFCVGLLILGIDPFLISFYSILIEIWLVFHQNHHQTNHPKKTYFFFISTWPFGESLYILK